MCFYRKDLTAGSYQFLSANADGSDQQVLANGKKPFPLLTVCSPSGRFAVLEDAQGDVESLDFGSGSTRAVASNAALGGYLNDMQWMPNGKGLFITGVGKGRLCPGQLSFLSLGKDATDHQRPERLFGHQSHGRCQDHRNHGK